MSRVFRVEPANSDHLIMAGWLTERNSYAFLVTNKQTGKRIFSYGFKPPQCQDARKCAHDCLEWAKGGSSEDTKEARAVRATIRRSLQNSRRLQEREGRYKLVREEKDDG